MKMIVCERCNKLFKEGKGYGIQREDGTIANVCTKCFNDLLGMPTVQVNEFLNNPDRKEWSGLEAIGTIEPHEMEEIRKLEKQKREIEKQIRQLKNKDNKENGTARLTWNETKKSWQIAVVGNSLSQDHKPGAFWHEYRDKPYDVNRITWKQILENTSKEEIHEQLKRVINGLNELDKQMTEAE